MSFRTVVIKERAKLETRLGYMVVRGENETRIHISEIDTLIVETTAAAITAGLMSELTKSGVNIIFCNEKHLPASQLLPLNGNFNASKNVKLQLAWDEQRKVACWTEIIRQKIRGQANILSKYGKREEAGMLEEYRANIALGDATNREGHAAKVYFNALFGLDFSRREEHEFNPPLNYGYAMLLSLFAREIIAAGYLTQLGVWHRGEFNFFNLACDFMEPFRPIIDDYVIAENLSADVGFKEKLKRIFEIKVDINGKMQYLPNAVMLYTRGVLNFLNSEHADDFPLIGGYDITVYEL